MKNKPHNLHFGIVSLLILLAALSRLIPHPPNFTALGAMALFGAAYLERKMLAFLIPLLALWLSDLLLNNILYKEYFSGFVFFYPGAMFTYGAFLTSVLMGIFVLRKINFISVFGSILAASLIFYLVSNFGVWCSGILYPRSFSGLLGCYIAGIPFLKYSLLGNLIYSLLLFGGFEWAKIHFPLLAKKSA